MSATAGTASWMCSCASDHCKLPSFPVPVRPMVPTPNSERAHMLYNTTTQRLEIFFVSNDSVLRRGFQTSPSSEVIEWQALSGHLVVENPVLSCPDPGAA
jgi:hypothetical protein